MFNKLSLRLTFVLNWNRTLLILVGLFVITTGILPLATTSQTIVAVVRQDLREYWRTTYDILVRPTNSRSLIEQNYGLVEANHLSGIWGGITFEQYETIKTIPDIEVTAPIAMIGYIPGYAIGEEMTLPSEPGVYGLIESIKVNNGLENIEPPGFPRREYYFFNKSPQSLESNPSLESEQTIDNIFINPFMQTAIGGINFPFLLAAIDPPQEAALVHLEQALVGGQYLNQNESLMPQYDFPWEGIGPETLIDLPILINATNYVNLQYHSELIRVQLPPEIITIDDISIKGGSAFLDKLPVEILDSTDMDSDLLYQQLINSIMSQERELKVFLGGSRAISTPSSIIYQNQKSLSKYDVLVFEVTTPQNTRSPGRSNYRISQEAWFNSRFFWAPKGIFDIEKLPKPPDINRVPLETYFPPIAFLRYDENGNPIDPPRELRPTLNPAGYIQSPPLVLTTLDAARALRGEEAISAIRVRVALEGCPGDYLTCPLTAQNQRKIETIAGEIARLTGLDVDITVGSSPTRVLVHVPGVGYVEEQWIQKNVTTEYSTRVQSGHRLLLGGLLGIGGLFVLDLAWAEVIARRRMIALQKALGWRSSTVFAQVLGQITLAGAIAAILGAFAAWGFSLLLGWDTPSLSLLGGVPLLIVGLALVGGVYPAWLASRVPPVVGLRRGHIRLTSLARFSKPGKATATGGLLRFAWQGLSRRWSRTALGALTATLSAALLVLMLAVTVDRQGAMSGTLLGEFILVRIEGYHYAIVGIGFGLAALSLANSLLAGVLERRREIGVFKATGWRTGTVARMFLYEGALIGVLGGLAGAALGAGVFVGLYEIVTPSLLWIGLAGAGLPVIVGILAAIYPARVAANVPPAEAVRYE